MKKIILLFLPFILAGCVSYQWVKPGSTADQAQNALLQCQADAIKSLPPNPQLSGNDSYKQQCNKNDANAKCDKTSNTDYHYVDANEDARDIIVKACMAKQGWKQIEIDN